MQLSIIRANKQAFYKNYAYKKIKRLTVDEKKALKRALFCLTRKLFQAILVNSN